MKPVHSLGKSEFFANPTIACPGSSEPVLLAAWARQIEPETHERFDVFEFLNTLGGVMKK